MKKNFMKKCLSMFLLLVMLVTLFPTSIAATETENQGQNVLGETVDITAPTDVSVVSFVENGQTIVNGSEIHFIITAQDAESEISAEKSHIILWVDNDMTWEIHGDSITPVEGELNTYNLTFSVPESGKCEIRKFKVADTAGNATDVVVENEKGEYLYTFDVENDETSTLVTELVFDKSEIILSDTVTSTEIGVTAKLNRELSETDVEWMWITFETELDDSGALEIIEMRLEYDDDEKVFKGTEKIDAVYQNGTYVIDKISYNNDSLNVTGLESSFSIKKNFTDNTAPKFTDFYFTKNGEKVDVGFSATAEDEIILYCSFDEEMYNYEDNWLLDINAIRFSTDVADISESEDVKFIDLDNFYNEETGMYEVPLDVSNWYPAEWYIQSFNISDKYFNSVNAEDVEYYTYFYVVKDGTCVIPTYEYELYVDYENELELINTVTGEKKITLGEILPETMPTVPAVDGMQHVGWEYLDDDEWIQLDENIEVLGVISPYVWIRPVYEKVEAPDVETTPDTEQKPETESTPDTDKTPETEPTPESKPVVELNAETITKTVENISASTEGTQIIIDMKKEDGSIATVVPAEVLESARENNVNIVLDMGSYSWSINSDDILDGNLSDINLEVTMDTNAIPSATVDALANGEKTRQLSLTHNGEFRFKASLTIEVGSEYEGEYGNLYYHDSTGKLVFMNAGKVQKDGTVTVNFSHASDYVIIIGDDRTVNESDTNGEVPPTDTTNPSVESPNTGDVSSVLWILLLAVGCSTVVAHKRKVNK